MRLESIGAALLLTTWSLAPRSAARSPTQDESVRAVLAVTNHNSLDVDIFVLAGSARIRLGTVVTSRSQEFNLPPQALGAGPVRISADPIGARAAYTSGPLTIADGDRIQLTVNPELAQSTISVEHGAAR